MDNSVNNNLNNANISNSVNNTVVTPTVAGTISSQPTVNVNNVQIPVTATNGQAINVTPVKNNSNTYLIVGFFVGFVLLAAIFLLVLLVTGVIGNRNRLTCSKTVTENGYTHLSQRYYKFDKGVFTQVNNTDTYTYTLLTDDIYNQKFGPILEITSGVTEYGFGTQVSREGNVVTITSYNPNFFGDTLDDVKADNAEEGFTCE